MPNSHSKLHNAMWPGLVGKEPGAGHRPISLDRMLELMAGASVNGERFDGIDYLLSHPHTDAVDSDAGLDQEFSPLNHDSAVAACADIPNACMALAEDDGVGVVQNALGNQMPAPLTFCVKARPLGNGRAICVAEMPVGFEERATPGTTELKWRFVNMRIDPGSDYTLVDRTIAPALGCRLSGAPSTRMRTAGGDVITVDLANVRMRLLDGNLRVATWIATIAFLDGVRTPLFGVSGCLELFDVEFRTNRIVLSPRQPFPGILENAA